MKFMSFARLFGKRGQKNAKGRLHRERTSRRNPQVETLEVRELLTGGLPDFVLPVTPLDQQTVHSQTPVLKISFEGDVDPADVTNPANYILFGSHNNSITVDNGITTAFNPSTNRLEATLPYHDPATNLTDPSNGNPLLLADSYTLLVKADQIHAGLGANRHLLAQPGQLAILNSGTNNVSFVDLLHTTAPNGSPLDRLQAISNYPVPTGESINDARVVDVSGDGVPDLIVLTDTHVFIFQGNPRGGFVTESPPQVLTITSPSTTDTPMAGSLVVAYLESGNPFPYIATANSKLQGSVAVGTDDVTVFPNIGGTFQAGTTYGAGTKPIAIVAADFNGAGGLDLAVAAGDQDSGGNFDVSLLYNNSGSGTFQAAQTKNIGHRATSMALADPLPRADINADNRGTAFFNSRHPLSPDLVVGTIDGVEVLDNVIPDLAAGVQIYFNLNFYANTQPTAGNLLLSPALGHFVTRTSLDYAFIDGRNIVVYANDGANISLVQTIAVPAGSDLTSLKARDVNGDGFTDLVAVDGTNKTFIYLNRGASSGLIFDVTNVGIYRVGDGPVAVDVAPASGDGLLSIVSVNNFDKDATLLRGNPNGSGGNSGQFLASADSGATGPDPQSITVGDFNGDGLPDVAVADRLTNEVSVLLRNLNGTYAAPVVVSSVGRAPVSLAAGDLNGDGRVDIVTANQIDNTISILYNQPPMSGQSVSFSRYLPASGQELRTGPAPTQVVIADFNNDGTADVAVSHIGNGPIGRGVSVFLGIPGVVPGPTVSPLEPAMEFAPQVSARALAVADFNNDGKLDIAVVDDEPNGNVAILQGDGTGCFLQSGLFDAGPHPSSIAIGDFNRDNLMDIVVTNTGTSSGSLSVLLNFAGISFGAPKRITSPLFDELTLASVQVMNVNGDFYPDLVVTSGTSLAGGALPPNTVFTLIGGPNAQFVAPDMPFATSGGGSGPAHAVVVSDPVIRVVTFTVGRRSDGLPTEVGPNVAAGGTFETSTLSNPGTEAENGNLVGWQTFNQRNSNGAWSVQQGTTSPLSATTVPAPIEGRTAAMLDQDTLLASNPRLAAAGSHALYRDFIISPTAQHVYLNLELYLQNQGTINGLNQYSDPSLDPSLDFQRSLQLGIANQQVRIDIMDPSADLQDVSAPNARGHGVLKRIFFTTQQTKTGTEAGGTFSGQYNSIRDILTFEGASPSDADGILDLKDLIDPSMNRTVRLRIVATNTQGSLLVGVDNVNIQEIFGDNQNPVLTGVALRNPGAGVTATLAGNTTDATVTGRVSDNGGVDNISAIIFDTGYNPNFTDPNDPNNPNFKPGPGKIVFNTASFDAVGNFAATLPLTLPSQIVNGQPVPYTIGVRVVDRAGNFSDQHFNFVYQPPTLGGWRAAGPGPIRVAAAGIDYSSVSGRVTAVASDPRDANGNTFYIGSANGGVWKTTDGGSDWTPLTDRLIDVNGNPVSASVSALAVSPSVPDTIYAGMGQADHALFSRPGTGLFRSVDGGITWNEVGHETFAGARITRITVTRPDEHNVTRIYVAVAVGGAGPGLYRSSDGGDTWQNVLDPQNMFLRNGQTLAQSGTGSVVSVTDVVINRLVHEDHDLYVGIGNIGFVDPGSGNAGASGGVWKSPNDGSTWFQVAGGSDQRVQNDTLPTGAGVGRITLALPDVRVVDDGIVYVLMAAATPFGSAVDSGRAEGSAIPDVANDTGFGGLFKSKNGGADWTHVMLRQSVPIPNDIHQFHNIDLVANTGGYTGALAIDPKNANVVYVGGERLHDSIQPVPERAFLRVDTRNMRDTTFGGPIFPNDGDDITKAALAGPNRQYADNTTYDGEGVSWVDLEQNTAGLFDVAHSYLLPAIHALSFDAQGRLIVATDGGVWRGVDYGFGYPASDSPGAIGANPVPASSSALRMRFTSLNGNLQIQDQTSVAIDTADPDIIYSAQIGTGWAVSHGSLTWASLNRLRSHVDPSIVSRLEFAPGVVRVGPVDPSQVQGAGLGGSVSQGNCGVTLVGQVNVPSNVYLTNGQVSSGNPVYIEQSTDGALTFQDVNVGLRLNDAEDTFPSLAVWDKKVFVLDPNSTTHGGYQDRLILGMQRVYRSENSATSWTEISSQLSSGDVVTATAIAETGDHVFYVGTLQGNVLATFNNGGDGFIGPGSGLPGTRINGLAIDPTNELIAYALTSSVGNEVMKTTDGGRSWTSIANNLPPVAAYAMAIDGRKLAGQPNGRLYVGTEVGVYTSTDGGKTWSRLGKGLPNVPVLDLQFNAKFEKLAIATLGRGSFVISTDQIGPQAIAVSPATPILPGFSVVTVAFNETIDPRTFSVGQIRSLQGPLGPIMPTAVTDIDPAHHRVYQITFPNQTADGTYTLNIGPNIADLSANRMDQNGNHTNGEDPADRFTAPFAINTTDDGRFDSGIYNDILGRASDTAGFLHVLSGVDTARFQALVLSALGIITSDEYRGDVIFNRNTSTGYYASLLGRTNATVSDDEINLWRNQLKNGMTPEQVIAQIASSQEFFVKTSGATDMGFIIQLYVNPTILGRSTPPSQAEINTWLAVLGSAETAARVQVVDGLDHSSEYFGKLVDSLYQQYLRRAPQPTERDTTVSQLINRTLTTEKLIINLVSSDEYFGPNATIVTPDTPSGTDGTNATWLEAIYQDLLGRSINDDPNGLAFYTNELSHGTPRSTVAQQIVTSTEYRKIVISGDVTKYLHRPATTSDYNTYLPILQNGGTYETVVSNIVASAEYYQLNIGSATTLPEQDVNWINAAYRDVLARATPPTSSEIQPWVNLLNQGESAARLGVAQSFVTSTEYKKHLINTVYVTYLGRQAGVADINAWLPLLGQGSAGPGHPSPDEIFLANVVGSVEYFAKQRQADPDPNHAGGTIATNKQWLTSLYTNLLGRPSDPNGYNANLQAILSRYQTERLLATTALTTSTEYYTNLVKSLYQHYLRRDPLPAVLQSGFPPAPPELPQGVAQFQNGTTQEQFIANLVSSREYFQNPNLGGGLNSQWLNQIYRDILSRDRDVAGSQVFLDGLNNGTLTRLQVATALLTSTEYRTRLIDSYYLTYLGRTTPPSAGEVAGWIAAIQAGAKDEQIIAAMTASNEYFLRTHPYP